MAKQSSDKPAKPAKPAAPKAKQSSDKPEVKPVTQTELPDETRGRKPKELCIEDIQNKAKELILDINAYVKVRTARGKNANRLRAAASDITRMLRTHFID